MRTGKVQIFYNEKKGFIITALAEVKEVGINAVVNPAVFLAPDISNDELGKSLKDNLLRSQNAMPIEREESKKYKFWHNTGIKSWGAFSKKFQCVSIYEKNNILELTRLVQGPTGAYFFLKGQAPTEVGRDTTDKELGFKIKEMFCFPEQEEKAIVNEFQTLNGSIVKCRMDIDEFVDAGDGHTDAYQIFQHENDEDTFFTFVIDSGYQDINEAVIKSHWEKLYGDIEEYEFKNVNKNYIKMIVSAKTKNAYIRSYFYRDAENWLELFVSISIDSKMLKDDLLKGKINTFAETVEISLSK